MPRSSLPIFQWVEVNWALACALLGTNYREILACKSYVTRAYRDTKLCS